MSAPRWSAAGPGVATPNGSCAPCRGTPQGASLAELDSLLAYEVHLESRLAGLLDRELASAR